jgi:hypothetical protein
MISAIEASGASICPGKKYLAVFTFALCDSSSGKWIFAGSVIGYMGV